MSVVIKLEDATKDYGGGKGAFGLNLEVKEGEVFGYLGPNGAGKTTTIRQLMGFLKPDSGSCRIFGLDCFAEAAKIQKDMGYLAGELAFFDDMTGQGFLEFMAQMKGITDRERMEELIGRFELDPRGRIRKMSKGMKQKIGIVCAFMGRPRAAILDEPTSGLDPLMQNRFVELILEEKRRGTTVFMSSHIFEEVEKTCDRTAIVRAGHIVAVEDMQELAGRREKLYTVTLGDGAAASRMAADKALRVKSVSGNRVQVSVGNNTAAALRQIAEYNPVDLDVRAQSLEELFLHFYGEKRAAREEGMDEARGRERL